MRTVELTDGRKAIPVVTKTYLHKDRVISIVTDLIFHDQLSYDSKKSEMIKAIRKHLWWQGVSVYAIWYEDTDDTPVINDIREKVVPIIEKLFPELS